MAILAAKQTKAMVNQSLVPNHKVAQTSKVIVAKEKEAVYNRVM